MEMIRSNKTFRVDGKKRHKKNNEFNKISILLDSLFSFLKSLVEEMISYSLIIEGIKQA
jgi:hypothetical protein